MATRKCRTCAARCYVIPEECLYDGTLFNRNTVKGDVLLSHLNKAQDKYLRPLLEACLTDLCAAITAFEDSNTAIPDAQQLLIEVSTDLLVAGTQLSYIRTRGFTQLTGDGFIKFAPGVEKEMWDMTLKDLQASVNESYVSLKEWLEANKADYPCLPNNACNDSNVNSVELNQGFMGFDGVSGNAESYLRPN